ncbi:hypothetical protein L6Q21_02050 [Sandaracinobacter sp. RS1-74]|uniref:phage fiber-tail adaptor protein n=1 Tax=Sandaracinobacteroides sayramensis TaxID=2913411 RepID=UPI001EDABE16|nr:hypothetical protein [Sandaracinobacteroides sayramensis]MCG2839763.1 hypothetical protein [Sandaracinobacteroides sayramensis]
MFLKDPQAVLEYRVDWAAALEGGAGIVESEWRVEPVEDGGVVVASALVDGAEAGVRLGGGVAGHLYAVRNHVRFSDGTRDERSLILRVEAR